MSLATVNPFVQILFYVAAVLVGLGSGMAANLLADRVAGDEEPPWRADVCAKCGASLSRRRLVPVIGLAASRRACAACGERASLRSPLVELALAAVFPLLLAHVSDFHSPRHFPSLAIFALDAMGCVVLAFVFAVDLEHHLILDVAIYPGIVVLILVALFFDHKAFAAMLFGVLIFGGIFLLFYVLGFLLYHQEALGFGDVKLAVLVGLLVGWPAVMTALVLSALFGAAVSVLLLGLGLATRRTFIPFGVFITGGAVLALLLAPPFW